MAMEQFARQHLRRNFGLGVVSGIAFNLYISILSTELVMTWFLSELTRSNLLISLLVPIELGSWYFLQLLLSGFVQRRPRTLYFYRLMGYIRMVTMAVLSFLTFVLDEPRTLLIVFMVLFAVNSLAAGAAGLPFLNILAKTIPPTRRGIYFGWRRFSGGLLGLLGGVLVRAVLSPAFVLGFPDNYALLFLIGFLITTVLVVSFGFTKEPAEEVDPRPVRLKEQLARAWRLTREDRNYSRYLWLRVTLLAGSLAVPFYAVYARRVLEAPENMVGIYLIASTLASVLSNLIAGRLGDRRGNRLMLRLASGASVLPCSVALLVGAAPGLGANRYLIFTLVFLFQGLYNTMSVIGGQNYVLELAPSIERVLYLGFANGVVGLALFASPLGGALVDWLGFRPLFLFSLVCGAIAVLLSARLKEPRAGTSQV